MAEPEKKKVPKKRGGKKFSSTYQPKNKNGRKKSKLKEFIKDSELSSDDVSGALKKVLLMNEAELKALGNNKNESILLRGFVKAVTTDISNGTLSNINIMLDRSIGKVTEKSEVKIMDISIGKPPSLEDAEFPEDPNTE